MAIAQNFRKFPEAMALQLVLIFGPCKWHTSRPTTRLGRQIRAARAALIKKTPQIVQWVKKQSPTWLKALLHERKKFARAARARQIPIAFSTAALGAGAAANP